MNTCDFASPAYKHPPIGPCEKPKKVGITLGRRFFFCIVLPYCLVTFEVPLFTLITHTLSFLHIINSATVTCILNVLFVSSECSFHRFICAVFHVGCPVPEYLIFHVICRAELFCILFISLSISHIYYSFTNCVYRSLWINVGFY
jgi:hypothetical protein